MEKYSHLKGVSGIYIIRNTFDNRVYIGSAVNMYNRIKDHLKDLKRNKHRNKYLQNFFNRHGMCLYWNVLKEVRCDDLIPIEQLYLDEYKSFERTKGFNIQKVAGSMLGFKHSEESKAKMSRIRKGKKFSKEARRNMSLSRQGSKHPRSKLNEKQVLNIRSEYKFRKNTNKMLAEEYGVCEHTVHYIIIRRTWKHI